VARWASKPIELGGGCLFIPLVLGPSGVPEVTDQARAAADPELAVLSAMAHGRGHDAGKALRIAVAAMTASLRLDAQRSRLYFDLIVTSLSEAARKGLQAMDPAKYEYQSEFAKRYIAQGKAEGQAQGKAEGQAALFMKLLALKFGTLTAETTARVQQASAEELDRWAERLLNAASLDDVLA
jgi:flagellar biosynthesis/type III secretory pathway protein FliH